MARWMPAPLVGTLAVAFAVANTLAWAVPVYTLTLLRVVSPLRSMRTSLDRLITRAAEGWIASNTAATNLAHATRYDVVGVEGLDRNASYLVNANHQSWTDIVVLQRVFAGHVPFLRFFLKKELIWVPILGLAWWALHFPFMKRYSRETLERHPELRGKDLETTRRICQRLRGTPVAILNFLEGTRFTPSKHAGQRSPYRHLLRPKAGGLAFVLGAMGDQLRSLIDVTIAYPGGQPSFWQFLCGEVPSVVVHVRERAIPAWACAGNYVEDPQCQERFQSWVRDIWQDKDELIDELVSDAHDGHRTY